MYIDRMDKEDGIYIYTHTHTQSMPQAVTLKKLKLNGFMKTYKTFQN